MLRLHDDRHTSRPDRLVNRQGDLTSQAFLHLKTASERLCDAGEFGETDDVFVGDVADVDGAEEGDHVCARRWRCLDADERVIEG